MDDYYRGGHSKYSLKVHLIFVTKYRKKIFKSDKRVKDVKYFHTAGGYRWFDADDPDQPDKSKITLNNTKLMKEV